MIGALMSVLSVKTNDGPGQVVDVSLCESVLNMMETLIPEYDLYGLVRERSGAALPGICPSNTYGTRDEKFIIVGGNCDSIFRRLMQTIGREDLSNDPELANIDGRVGQAQLIDAVISDYTVAHDLADLLREFDESQIPCSPIYSAADIVAVEQFHARGAVVTETLPDGTTSRCRGYSRACRRHPGKGAGWALCLASTRMKSSTMQVMGLRKLRRSGSKRRLHEKQGPYLRSGGARRASKRAKVRAHRQ